MQSTEKTIRQFFIDNAWLGKEGELHETDSLLENGIIDSVAMIELVGFIEETYGIHVPDEDLMPEYFDTLASIVEYIEKQKQAIGG
jgi:acyl carrier protein